MIEEEWCWCCTIIALKKIILYWILSLSDDKPYSGPNLLWLYIVIGVVLGVILIGLVVYCCAKKGKQPGSPYVVDNEMNVQTIKT